MRRTSFFSGPAGTCSCCDKPVFVRLGSMLKATTETSWVASPTLLGELYRSAVGCVISKGEKYVKEYWFEKRKDGNYHRTPTFALAEGPLWRCPSCMLKASTLLWVDLDGTIGELTEQIDGPFCGRCFKRFKQKFESSEGVGADLPVYYLPCTDKRRQEIEAIVEDGWGPTVPSSVEEPAEVPAPTDSVEGLF